MAAVHIVKYFLWIQKIIYLLQQFPCYLLVLVGCSYGTYYDIQTKKCTLCPWGTYQDKEAQFSCIECPTWQPGSGQEGATTLEQCNGMLIKFTIETLYIPNDNCTHET